MPNIAAIATWPFGEIAVKSTGAALRRGESALDAALAGAQAVEDDPTVTSVGYGGIANAIGTVQLDACVMEGRTLNCGGVAALQNVRHAAAVAKRVMEHTPHVLLVGEGAQLFALEQGFPLENVQTPASLEKWQKNRPKRKKKTDDHDTVTVLALDQKGSLGGVCTTSGLAFKRHGRVGDSPLIGSGLYVDDSAGAAGATGVGEEIIRIGGSFLVVELMRSGKTPEEACEVAVKKVNDTAVRRGVHPATVAFIALNKKGEFGAACTAGTNFRYATTKGSKAQMHKAKQIGVEGK